MDAFRRFFSKPDPMRMIKEIEDETIDRWIRGTGLSESMVRFEYKSQMISQFEDQVKDHKELRDHLKKYQRKRF